jgi:hypothetical protein
MISDAGCPSDRANHMANRNTKVIPIRRGTALTEDEKEIVELAFALWLERFGRRYGSPRDDFLRAWQEVRTTTAVPRKPGAGLSLVTRGHS